MVGDLKLNGDSRMIELAHCRLPILKSWAKTQRRKFTAEYKLGIVEVYPMALLATIEAVPNGAAAGPLLF